MAATAAVRTRHITLITRPAHRGVIFWFPTPSGLFLLYIVDETGGGWENIRSAH